MLEISDCTRRGRTTLELSQRSLAARCRLHRNTVCALENGSTDPSFLTAAVVLAAVRSEPPARASHMLTRSSLRELGEALRARRRSLGLSQERLAERAGLHRNTVGLVERAEVSLDLSTFLSICRVLDVTTVCLETGCVDVT